MNQESQILELKHLLEGKSAEEIIHVVCEKYGDKIALASSLGAEDQILTYMLSQYSKDVSIFTLDTGRMFYEVYDLISTTNKRFGMHIKIYTPDHNALQELVNTHGINPFYKSVDLRKRCCEVRKIEPLQRAFQGLDAWICGLRAEQAVSRNDIELVEWDSVNNLVKINPLAAWTEIEVWDYIKKYKIPYNVLHDHGYPSIGCQPCTRAVKSGEDVRAGRWWWENPETKECGLHKR